MVADHAEIAQRYVIELWEERDQTVLDALVDDGYVLRDPISVVDGRDALAARLRDKTFRDVMIIIEDIVDDGDRVVVRATWQGVHEAPFFGIEPTSRRVVLDTVQVLTFARGKVSEDATYYDAYALFEQLGVLPSIDKLARPARLAPVLRLVP